MAVIHPDSADRTIGSRTYGTDTSLDLLNTGIVTSGDDKMYDDDGGTKATSSQRVVKALIFDQYVETNEVWMRAYLTSSSPFTDSPGYRLQVTDDGGNTWTTVHKETASYDWNWVRFQFDAKVINGVRLAVGSGGAYNNGAQMAEIEVHRALIPGQLTASINKQLFDDDSILTSTVTATTDTGTPVNGLDVTAQIIDDDGSVLVDKAKTTNSNGEATLNDVTDVDAAFEEDTYYRIEWRGGGFLTTENFYVYPKQQAGYESVVQVYSAQGNPVRNANVYVDGHYVGSTGRDGQLGIRYSEFPTKTDGVYTIAVVKGRVGAAQRIPVDEAEYVQFGQLNATDTPNSLDTTTASRYSNAY